MAKRTKIVLHINTGELKENGKHRQVHAILWNSDRYPDTFNGGIAEVVTVDGKSELVTVTQPVEVNGLTFQEPVSPMRLFVNRDRQGRIRNLGIKNGETKTGEIKFRRHYGDKLLLSGTYNATGLQFEENHRVKAGVEGNRALYAEVVGGMKDEIIMGMINMDPANDAEQKTGS